MNDQLRDKMERLDLHYKDILKKRSDRIHYNDFRNGFETASEEYQQLVNALKAYASGSITGQNHARSALNLMGYEV